MAKFKVQVEIDCDTLVQAQQVIAERISPDEDYGFDYTIGYGEVKVPKDIAIKLHNIRKSIEREEVSTSELIELQNLTEYIGEDDILLREWAGMPEFPEDDDKGPALDGDLIGELSEVTEDGEVRPVFRRD